MSEWEDHMENFNPEEVITFELIPDVMEVYKYVKGIRDICRLSNNSKRSLFRILY